MLYLLRGSDVQFIVRAWSRGSAIKHLEKMHSDSGLAFNAEDWSVSFLGVQGQRMMYF